jgi:hypothetical protein
VGGIGSWEIIAARAGTGHGEHRDTAARGVYAGKNNELGPEPGTRRQEGRAARIPARDCEDGSVRAESGQARGASREQTRRATQWKIEQGSTELELRGTGERERASHGRNLGRGEKQSRTRGWGAAQEERAEGARLHSDQGAWQGAREGRSKGRGWPGRSSRRWR